MQWSWNSRQGAANALRLTQIYTEGGGGYLSSEIGTISSCSFTAHKTIREYVCPVIDCVFFRQHRRTMLSFLRACFSRWSEAGPAGAGDAGV